MASVAGIILEARKHLFIALQAIKGVGPTRAKQLCKAAGVDLCITVKALPESVLDIIREEIGKLQVEGELRREVATRIRRLEVIKCYRGIRHLRHLPVRGQRTRTNARTRKGPRKMVRK